MSETLAARAQATLHDWVQSESLRKHCYAVADSMKHFARLRGEDADLWEAVGLLHDMFCWPVVLFRSAPPPIATLKPPVVFF